MELKPRGPRSTGPPIMIGSLAHGRGQCGSSRNTQTSGTLGSSPAVSMSCRLDMISSMRPVSVIIVSRQPCGGPLAFRFGLRSPMKWPAVVSGSEEQIGQKFADHCK